MTAPSLWIFWLSLSAAFFVYAGYPAVLWVLGRIVRRPVRKGPFRPKVSIVIAAYNEEAFIARTLENKLSLDYPADLREILVVSDGSTDRTEEIARAFAGRGVRLLVQNPRQGKTAGLNRAVAEATGEVLVFSDANSLYAPDALEKLLRNFADPAVGYVTGKMLYVDERGSLVGSGCDAYMRYENMLRALETGVGSVVGVDGGVDAVRRALYDPMSPDMLPDFVLPLRVVEKGFRVVYEEEAFLRESALSDAGDEARMRVRVTLRSLHALWLMRRLFNPFAAGIYSFQLLSHKLLRYGMGAFQAAAFASNAALWREGGFYGVAFSLQAAFYGLALVGHFLSRAGKSAKICKYPYYFCLLNLCAAVAAWKFLKGEKKVLWQPRKG